MKFGLCIKYGPKIDWLTFGYDFILFLILFLDLDLFV